MGAATIDADTLNAKDMDMVCQLIAVVVDVFRRYGAMWEKFQHMESGVDDGGGGEITSGKPHLVIADMELKLLTERHAWAADPAEDSPQFDFMENTDVGRILRTLTDAELFTAPRPAKAPFIRIAKYARPGNRIELQRTLYTSFDEASYKVYERRLVFIELTQAPVAVTLNEEEIAIAESYKDGLEESTIEFSDADICDMRGAVNRVDSEMAGNNNNQILVLNYSISPYRLYFIYHLLNCKTPEQLIPPPPLPPAEKAKERSLSKMKYHLPHHPQETNKKGC
jgi:hypothetical protein